MATYYLDETGIDDARRDGLSTPTAWRTLAYACNTRVTSGPNTIHLNAGTYTETVQSVVAPEINIEGVGITSIIHSHIAGTSYTLSLISISEGTNGNQTISNLEMDGDSLTAYAPIEIRRRSNVIIHDCTFINFSTWGIYFYGGNAGPDEEPLIWATGNKFYNNIVTNCAEYYLPHDPDNGEGRGSLNINGQDGILVYGNTITCTARDPGHNGYPIKGVDGCYKNIKIYNNTITAGEFDGITWDFAIELWDSRGGNEIYNNEIIGSVDISGYHTQKGDSSYSVWIHDNNIGRVSLGQYEGIRGILLEQDQEYILIERNYVKNVAVGIYSPLFGSVHSFNHITIRDNIFENIGVNDSGEDYKGWAMVFEGESPYLMIYDEIDIYNNIFTGHSGVNRNMWGIGLPSFGTATNIRIRNNIIKDFYYAPIFGYVPFEGISISNLWIEHNLCYNNGNSDDPRYNNGLVPDSYVYETSIKTDPKFIGGSPYDYHLDTGSPAIGTGIGVGLNYDYEGDAWLNPPSIGAYEYGSGPSPIIQGPTVLKFGT